MSNLLILSGISNSGKSTFARKVVDVNPSQYIIIGRDKLREMSYGYKENNVFAYYNREDFNELESQITAMQNLIISFWLKKGKAVIVDNTNLKRRYIREFEKFGVPIEVKYFDITLKEALTRDMGRDRKVGEEVITKQYSYYINLRANPY